MREGFMRLTYENVFRGRRYDIDFGADSFGVLENREVLSEPVMYGRMLHFEFTDGIFSQNVDTLPAYIREVR